MAKKEESSQGMLGLVPLAQAGVGSGLGYGLAVSARSASNQTEHLIMREAHKQELVIDLQTEKTRTAAYSTAAIRQQGADAFHQTGVHHAAINAAVQGQTIQPYTEEFNHRNLQLMAQNTLEIMQAGVGIIVAEVRRPIYREDVAEPKPNVIQRLLNGA